MEKDVKAVAGAGSKAFFTLTCLAYCRDQKRNALGHFQGVAIALYTLHTSGTTYFKI